MTNNREKGKRGERKAKSLLQDTIPDLQRNAAEQSRYGGNDLISEENPELAIEVKHGKSYNYKGVQKIIKQMSDQATDEQIQFGVVLPQRLTPYIIMPIDSFKQILKAYLDNK